MKFRAPNDLIPASETLTRPLLRRLLSVQVFFPVLTLATSLVAVVVATKVMPRPDGSETPKIATMPRIRRPLPPEPEPEVVAKWRAVQRSQMSTAKRS